MKRALAIALTLALLPCIPFTAAAEHAITCRTIFCFGGPGEQYADLLKLPYGMDVEILGIETIDGVEWAFCEFSYAGRMERAYIEWRYLEDSGNSPAFTVDCISCFMNGDTTVYATPYSGSAVHGIAKRDRMINYLNTVDGENGGFYDFIEYFDRDRGMLCRGYVPSDSASYTGDPGAIISQDFRVVDAPTDVAATIGQVGQYEIVGYLGTENGFARIQFFSGAAQKRMFGYVPADIVEIPDIN